MTHFEIRKKFLDFFENKHHRILQGSSLVPHNDPSLLFVNAGMNQFKKDFLGLKAPKAKNVATIQKCLRAGGKHNDLEEVGESFSHHTFFEMLGNFSFGGYFKEEAIDLAWRFLTEELKLSPKDLWITVHREDEKSYRIWKDKQKIPEHKIYRLDDKDNFWQMGDTGPCGYCSEIHYYSGTEKKPDPGQLIEVWNLVFMEFNQLSDGKREKLPLPCVDTGMGLERLCALLQNKTSNYHTDLFSEIISSLEEASGKKYDWKEIKQTERQKAFRVIADHSRSVCFLINEDIVPGNDRENYVLRRIIRRALYYSQKLHPSKNLLQIGAERVISLMSGISQTFAGEGFSSYKDYFDLQKEKSNIHDCIHSEYEKFSNSLKEGNKRLEEEIESSSKTKFITAKTAWNLYNTYGFPMDLTRLIAKEKGWTVATEGEVKKYIGLEQESINKKLRQQQKFVRIGQGEKQKLKESIFNIEMKSFIKQYSSQFLSDLRSKAEKTGFTGYEKNKEEAQILFMGFMQMSEGIGKDDKRSHSSPKLIQVEDLQTEKKAWIVLDKSCFYPEGGGPIGDKGFLKTETGRAEVLDCQKESDFLWHQVKVLEGELKKGQIAQMEVNINHRKEISASHTATHLLNSALRAVLGDRVRQAGSLVKPGYLRFDFTYPKALTKEQCQKVEKWVWQSVAQKEKLFSDYKDFEEAKRDGFLFLKNENYTEPVRVICVGESTSKELCGGIHVQNTEEIKNFKILNETGVQSGVRRIEAYTGFLAESWESFLIKQNLELRKFLGLPIPKEKQRDSLFFKRKSCAWRGLIEKTNPFLVWLKTKDQEIKKLRKRIVCLEEQTIQMVSQQTEMIQTENFFHPLALQTLELREIMNCPLPMEEQVVDFFLNQSFFDPSSEDKKNDRVDNQEMESWIEEAKDLFEETLSPLKVVQEKEKEIQKLQDWWKEIKSLGLTRENLISKAKKIQMGDRSRQLLVASLPIENRKILSDLSDILLSKITSGLLILRGESDNKHPVLVNLTKDMEEFLSAGELLKNTIAPFCKGQGGGKTSFAQGSITDKKAFSQLEKMLLDKWSNSPA